MRRHGTPISHEVLVEEARFILRTLQRSDLFGERVRLTEAERVLDSSISLGFADYCGFLGRFGYVRVEQAANLVEVTELGAQVAHALDDAEFHARLARYFARELGASARAPSREVGPSDSRVSLRPPSGGPERGPEELLDRRYRRGEIIGTGVVGTVYRAQHVSLGRPVAIKEARNIFQFASYLRRDDIVRRLRHAIESHARLVHPNILPILDQNPEREHPYFVMEHASGGNLRQRAQQEPEGRLDLHVAVRVLLQTAYALRHAHGQGVLHLGLKPENVLFDNLGNVRLADFGFARITDRADDHGYTPVLVGGGMVGYLAPERLQAGAAAEALSPAADVYALGMLFYEMLTGRLPGRRSPLPSQARKEVPSAFDEVFDRMTRDDLAERHRSIDEVLEGVYRAFPTKEVHLPGTILLWAVDPKPLPEPPAPAVEPEAELEVEPEAELEVEPAELIEAVVALEAEVLLEDDHEERTGEIALRRPEAVSVRPAEGGTGAVKKRPPPPPGARG